MLMYRVKSYTHSRAFLNCSSRPIMQSVSRESIKVAPRPPKLLTPFFDCGWHHQEKKTINHEKCKFKRTNELTIFTQQQANIYNVVFKNIHLVQENCCNLYHHYNHFTLSKSQCNQSKRDRRREMVSAQV